MINNSKIVFISFGEELGGFLGEKMGTSTADNRSFNTKEFSFLAFKVE